jgi:alanine racemase
MGLIEQEKRGNPSLASGYSYGLTELIRQRAWVEIDQNALIHNVRQFKGYLKPGTELMAVVKADAYGHGAIRVAQLLLQWGADRLAIATLGEGIALREAGIKAPILILGVINSPEEVEAVAHWHLEPTLISRGQALLLAQTLASRQQTLGVHLKIDTGMSRLGIPHTEALPMARLLQELAPLTLKSVYSHLATADEPNSAAMIQQQRFFEAAIAQLRTVGLLPPCVHLANSAATLQGPEWHYDLVRVGLGLYGIHPASHLQERLHLKPVLGVKAKITQIKNIPAGTGVSYGHQFISDRPLKIAVVGIGYADGVPRNLSNRLRVLVRGQWVRQIGAITMDQMMLDVSHLPDLQETEVVTLIGQDGTQVVGAVDWAHTLQTIPWEILCGFKHRLPRIIV